VLPAHGLEFVGLRDRVDALLTHHGERLSTILESVGNRDRAALDVARDLSWTRRQRRFDELDLFNRTLAVLETALHLDLLGLQGSLNVRDVDGVRHYSRCWGVDGKGESPHASRD
jgi:hypothetical protein